MFVLPRRCAVACTFAFAPLLALADSTLAPVQVTGTRERVPIAETPASIGVVDAGAIDLVKPTHPSQLLSQVPGVAIAVTNGEGHSTSIRQPFTTSPVYLFLEDGVPSRATGFFNHNGLYELDIPQAGGVEIVRGPGTALYGSDAIGGIVNVLSRTPPDAPRLEASLEGGGHGWWRVLAGGGAPYADGGVRADLNVTHTDGWRDSTAYDRRGGLLRWDHAPATTMSVKTIVAFSTVDQETGANSPLVEADYRNDPRTNYLPIAFRKVDALRVHSAWEYQSGRDLFSVTPYFRDNRMELLASFALNFDPTVYDERNRSYGVLAKWRRDFDGAMRPRLIVGADVDVSPGERREDAVVTTPSGSGATRRFDDYSTGPRIYDYDVEYRGFAAYVHGELSPLRKLRVTAGVRYDHVEYRFDNAFDSVPLRVARAYPGVRFYGQPADTTVRFDHASPKLGATWEIDPTTHVFASYNHGFRVPSQSQLFRPSATTSAAASQALVESALALQPIKAGQAEVGVRGSAGRLRYDVVVYELRKRDDIVTLRDTATNFTQTVNAGRTRHRGIEAGLGVPVAAALEIDAALSYAKHEYRDWATANGDFSGNEIEAAPRVIGNVRLTWRPGADATVQLEWVKVGSYWLDAANTRKYGGHDVVMRPSRDRAPARCERCR